MKCKVIGHVVWPDLPGKTLRKLRLLDLRSPMVINRGEDRHRGVRVHMTQHEACRSQPKAPTTAKHYFIMYVSCTMGRYN